MNDERLQEELADAKLLLEQNGYVILKATSYRRAQERQRLAQHQREWAERDAEEARRWARDCLYDERRLRERLTFVWGVATSHGATAEELAADPLTREVRTR